MRPLPVRPQASSIRAEVAGQRVSSSVAACTAARTRSNASCSLMTVRAPPQYGRVRKRPHSVPLYIEGYRRTGGTPEGDDRSRVAAVCSASHGTASDGEPAAVETRAAPISLCRKRSFATDGQGHRPTRAAVCRILCLILCLAYVWRVGQCRAPHERRGAAGYTATSCRISAVLTAPLNTRWPWTSSASLLEAVRGHATHDDFIPLLVIGHVSPL